MAAEEIQATVPITVTVDLEQLLTAQVGEVPAWTGDPDDEYEPPTPLIGAIITGVAHTMALKLMSDSTGYNGMKHAIKSRIDEQISEIVAGQLDREFLPVDSYGEVIRSAEPTTLREQIKKQASDALAKGMSPADRYGSSAGGLKKYIDTEIDRQIKSELAEAVKEAKAAVVAKVQANAAQVITDTITRSAVR
jgi:hypothetical protein